MCLDNLDKKGDETKAASAGTSATGLRILLVEDHHDTRMSMEILLRRATHTVRSASTAAGALTLAAKETFDVVITDLGLPDRSGLDLMAELNQLHGLKGIATSGYAGDSNLAKHDGPFLDLLIKPIRMDRLRELLTEIQTRAKGGAE